MSVHAVLRRSLARIERPHASPTSLVLALLLVAGWNAPPANAQSQSTLQFNGTNQSVTFGSAPSLGVSTFTVEVRFKRTGAGVVTSTGTGGITKAIPLFTKGRGEAEGSNLDMNFFLGIDSTTSRLAVDFEEGTGQTSPGLNHPLVGTTTLANNTWYHAAATFDGSVLSLYLNGALESSLSLGAGRLPQAASVQHAGLATAMNSSGTAAGFFQGVLEEVRLWSVARTQTQIFDYQSLEVSQGANLVARWGLNEGAGTAAGNSMPLGVQGTLVNAPSWVVDSTLPLATEAGLRFGGLSTGGTNAYTTFGNADSLRLSAFTIEMWARRDSVGLSTNTGSGGIGNLIPLLSKGRAEAENSAADVNYIVGIRASDGVLCADFEEAASGASPSLNHPVFGVTPIAPMTGVWHHVAFTYDGAAWRIYLDGYLETSLTVGRPTNTACTAPVVLCSSLLSGGTTPGGYFNGAVDEVRIWKGARTQAEIVASMNSAITGPAANLMARWGLNEDAGTTVASSAGTLLNGTVVGTNWAWAAGSPFNAVPPPPPTDPTGLTATAISASQIDLTWTDTASSETAYEVERSTAGAGGPFSLLVSLPANSTAYSNASLTSSTEYCYRVRAVNAVGASGYTGVQCATTLTAPPPAAPTDLVATAVSAARIDLTWTDQSSDETGFEIRRSTTGVAGSYTLLATTEPNVASYADNALMPSTEYCYQVRTVRGSDSSSDTGPACATTPENGDALALGGADAYVDFGNAAALKLSAFTIEMWVRRDGTGVGTNTGTGGIGDLVPLFAKGRADVEEPLRDINYIVGFRQSTGTLGADFEEGAAGPSPSLNHPVLGATALAIGTWYHAAATYDGTTWRLYLNGSLDAELAVGRPAAVASDAPAALGSALTLAGAAAGFLQGTVDEVRVWNVARTPAEILATINDRLAAPTQDLVARWAMDEGTGTTIPSTAGTPLDGTIVGASWSWAAGAPFNITPPTLPAAPTGLTAVAGSPTQINLAWTDASSNETGFEIERSTTGPGGTFALLDTAPANAASYADNTASPSTEYCYRVRAVNGVGSSAYAGPECATTSAVSTYALSFSGSTYVTFGDPAALDLPRFTLECWFRRDGAGTTVSTGTGGISDAIPLVTHGTSQADGSNVDMNFFLGIKNAGGFLCADFEEGSGGSTPGLNHPIVGTTALVSGVWYHGAATYDGTTWRLYVNGNLEATSTVGQPVQSASIQIAALASSITSTGTAQGYFVGALDEVRVWDAARTLAQIQSAANVQLSTPTPGLVARWSLDEGTGTAVNGSAGTVVNGTITGAGYSWVAGAPFDLAFNLPPDVPFLLAPADHETLSGASPALQVSVSDPDGEPLTVSYYGRSVTSTPGPDFTIVGMPDTQYYTGELNGATNAILLSQTNWIATNRAARNIAYVATLGDCVENGDKGGDDVEWRNADAGYSIIENPGTTGLPAGIPYGITVGNHDQSPIGSPDGASTVFYNQYFGVDRFAGRPYYGGHYGTNNDNWFDLFSASGMDFIVISLEYDTTPDAAVLAWADGLLTTYANRRAIVLSHNFAGTGNPASFSTQGQATYDALKGHSNLFLMLCGHVPGEGRRQDTFNGNTVYTVMSDYQSRTNGGNGWLRTMEFSPANNVIRVRTYSPWLDQSENDADSQFDLPYSMDSGEAFALIGTMPAVPSGSSPSLTWSNLEPATPYEWYVTVGDGVALATSPTWHFTTTAITFGLATAADDAAGGSIAKSPDRALYAQGASVNVTANPAAGWEFRGWAGDAVGLGNPTTVSMSGNKSVVAIFNEIGAPTVQVQAPNGGENLTVGYGLLITWSASDLEEVASVDVLLSRGGPAGPFETIETDVPNRGWTSWAVTGPTTNDAFLKIVAHNPSPGQSGWDVSDSRFAIVGAVTGVEDLPGAAFAVKPVRPNPMTGRGQFVFSLPAATNVRMEIYDVQGRRVARLADRTFGPGTNQFAWAGRGDRGEVPAGVYFFRLSIPGKTITKRFVLVR